MSTEPVSLDLDRRSFMKASALAGAVALGGGGAGQALAQSDDGEEDGTDTDHNELTKTICNYCSVGCGFHGEKKGDAFVGMEPWEDHPVNNGSLCSKGAGIYETEHSERRLKSPMRKVDGGWEKLSWDEAYSTVSDELTRIKEEYGADSTMWLGSAHHSNEESYAFRKLASLWGTNNVDHQARICHSTTVAGLANTWGYGAMTNSINDYRNFDMNLIIGQNPAEAHPIAMQHILEGQKRGGDIVVVEPRFTKTAAHADYFYRLRPGTDVALMMGVIKQLRDRDELDDDMLEGRVQAWPDVENDLDDYDLETVSDITWLSTDEIEELTDLVVENKPKMQIEWAMGGTQHNNGTQNIRSYAMLSLGAGAAAQSGGGLQVMRGHANVQGATDLAVASHILPGYYSVGSPGSWQYWCDVWSRTPQTSGTIEFEDLIQEYGEMPPEKYVRQSTNTENADEIDESFPAENSMMFQKGLTVARWFDAALPQEERLNETPIYQPNELKAAIVWGHSLNSISEMEKQRKAIENLDLLVVVDVFPSVASVLADVDQSDTEVVLLAASSQYEHYRSLTNSHRATQWSEPVRSPGHNSRPDLQIMQELAGHLGMGEHFDWGSGPDLYNGKSTYEAVIREFNLGMRTIGYCQDPERLQQHLEYDYAFSTEDTKADAPGTPVDGEYWMLPWPCWGEGHPGTPILWNDDMDPRDGGQDFRTRWGVQAPTPEEWEEMATDEPYPMQTTYDEQGEEGLSLLRDSYEPEWWDGTIEGVPQYPGFATTMPDDPSNADALTVPYEYALREDTSVADAAEAMNQKYDWADYDMDFYGQFDNPQPDAPTGRGRARGVVWSFLDTTPVHREPIESPRPDLVEQWPSNGQQLNFYRLDQNNSTVQEESMQRLQDAGAFDEQSGDAEWTILTSGRQVEHQGGGSETRSNKHTADLQPHMYVEINPDMAERLGIDGGDLVVASTTDRGSILVKARVTHRPNDSETFFPFHWGGMFKGESLEDRYPEGTVPYAIGEPVNAITSRGYDVETQMQETKVSMVRLQKATPSVVEELSMRPVEEDGLSDNVVDIESYEFPQDRDGFGRQKDFDVRDSSTVQ